MLSYNDARFVAICDVRYGRREVVKSLVDKRCQSSDCRMHTCQEDVLARDDIDAVIAAEGSLSRPRTPVPATRKNKPRFPCLTSR